MDFRCFLFVLVLVLVIVLVFVLSVNSEQFLIDTDFGLY